MTFIPIPVPTCSPLPAPQVGDGLAMRKPLFESLEEHEWEEVIRKLHKFYTNKENKSEMDRVWLIISAP